MVAIVRIPAPLRKYTGGQRQLSVEASTVAGVIESLIAAFPELRAGLYRPDGALRDDARLFVGSDDIRLRQGLDTPVLDGETVSIVPPVAGA